MMEIQTTVRDFLSRNAAVQNIQDDDDLLATGLLDSVAVLSLVAELEKSFKITIDTKQLNEDNFRSIHAIAQMVQRLVNERSPS